MHWTHRSELGEREVESCVILSMKATPGRPENIGRLGFMIIIIEQYRSAETLLIFKDEK